MAATTMNPIYTSTEIARQLKMSKASWAVTNRDLVPVIKDAITKLGQNPAGEEWKNRIIIVDKEPGKFLFYFLARCPHVWQADLLGSEKTEIASM